MATQVGYYKLNLMHCEQTLARQLDIVLNIHSFEIVSYYFSKLIQTLGERVLIMDCLTYFFCNYATTPAFPFLKKFCFGSVLHSLSFLSSDQRYGKYLKRLGDLAPDYFNCFLFLISLPSIIASLRTSEDDYYEL